VRSFRLQGTEEILQLQINGKQEEVQANTVLELLQAKEIEPQMVSVELNSVMVDRSAFSSTPLKEGDKLEFLFFMGGGGGFDR
jgi:sulfur carrier protein